MINVLFLKFKNQRNDNNEYHFLKWSSNIFIL